MGCIKLVCLALTCVTAFGGQVRSAASVTKAPGDTVTLEIWAKSLPHRAPVALHWDVVFPTQLMEIIGHGQPGSAATKSGKSLQCKVQNAYSYSCALSGGDKPIADGLIAIFHFRVRPDAPAGTTSLRIERAVSTAADFKVSSLENTNAMVVIRTKSTKN